MQSQEIITNELINEYKNRLESKIYLEYKEKFKSYLEYKENIIDDEYKNNITSYYKENNNKYEIYKENTIHMIITKPVYSNIWNKINYFKKERNLLIIDYEILIRKNLYNTQETTIADDKNINEIIKKLSNLDNNIQYLYEYYLTVNNFDKNIYNNLSQIQTMNNHIIEQYNNIINEVDYESKINLIKSYINMYSTVNNDYEKLLNKNKEYNSSDGINFIIEKIPKITILKQTREHINERKRQVVRKNTEKIELKIKNVLKNQFKFKNLKECNSQKKSALYYMTKEEIVEIINNNNELKSKMPENYSNKEKKEICKILAEKKYISKEN
jgi:hypothetical protein